MNAPCFLCDDREVGCHTKCSRYVEFRKHMDKAMEQRELERKAVEFGFWQREHSLNRIKKYKNCDKR